MITKSSKKHHADCIIVGAGIFGLYAANLLIKKNYKVIIVEKSLKPFSKASAINQARVHNGYHYPRSYETAIKVAEYYKRFINDFAFAINDSFKQIYAIDSMKSKTSTTEFIDFCRFINIPLKEIDKNKFFTKGSIDKAFITEECSFDFKKIKNFLLTHLTKGTKFIYSAQILRVEKENSNYSILLDNGISCSAPLVINATYSGVNDVISRFGQELFDIKYELCEVAFCKVSEELKNIGITVMDGDFFSIMPFGKRYLHTFTSVEHTPHQAYYKEIPNLSKSISQKLCRMHLTNQCNICYQEIKSAWNKMHNLSKIYLKPKFSLEYMYSQFEIKTILAHSEQDDSRPTIIKRHTSSPTFISILSGKMNTFYDLEKYFMNL